MKGSAKICFSGCSCFTGRFRRELPTKVPHWAAGKWLLVAEELSVAIITIIIIFYVKMKRGQCHGWQSWDN